MTTRPPLRTYSIGDGAGIGNAKTLEYTGCAAHYLKEIIMMTADTTKERLTTDFPGQDKKFVFEPNCIVMEKIDGTVINRDDPEASFAGQQGSTPWNDFDVIYFQGEALWAYGNTPFRYTREGFATEEIPSIQVHGETWRRLRITFPDYMKSHTRRQSLALARTGCFAATTTKLTFSALQPA